MTTIKKKYPLKESQNQKKNVSGLGLTPCGSTIMIVIS